MPAYSVDEYDPREEKLAINRMSTITLSSPHAIPRDKVLTTHWVRTVWDDSSAIREVYDRFFPVLLSTGIFEKTPIIKFHIVIIFVEPDEMKHVTKHSYDKSRIHCFSKTFHWDDFPKESKEELVVFCLKLMSEGLLELCIKRKLEQSPVLALMQELSFAISGAKRAKEVVIEESTDEEVRLHIKLEAEFGNADELIRNTQIIESIAYHLEERGVGWFDASENGGGFETIFCCGPSAEEMKKVLLEIFDGVKLPKGSYFEFDDGEKEELPN